MERVRTRVADAAARAGRDPASVTFVGVTKTFPAEVVAQGLDAGLQILAENRVQEAQSKAPQLRSLGYQPKWHLIGHLQSNKVRPALTIFDHIQSVDSVKLAHAIDRVSAELQSTTRVLLEVNTSRESSKYGFLPEDVSDATKQIATLEHLDIRGLMAVGPLTHDKEVIREAFRALRCLGEDLRARFPSHIWDTLSMGMSDDFEIAVEEGSTMLRLGRVIFGDRPLKIRAG